MKRMRPKLKPKLRSRRGESLAEVLISLLIAALALTMLAAVIGSTSRILKKSNASIKAYYAKNDELSAIKTTLADNPDTPTVKITVTLDAPGTGEGNYRGGEVFLAGQQTAKVAYFSNDKLGEGKKVISYCLPGTNGGLDG